MTERLNDFLDAIGPLRGLLLVTACGAAWRAVHVLQLDDGRNPLPWAFVLIACIAVLALVSL